MFEFYHWIFSFLRERWDAKSRKAGIRVKDLAIQELEEVWIAPYRVQLTDFSRRLLDSLNQSSLHYGQFELCNSNSENFGDRVVLSSPFYCLELLLSRTIEPNFLHGEEQFRFYVYRRKIGEEPLVQALHPSFEIKLPADLGQLLCNSRQFQSFFSILHLLLSDCEDIESPHTTYVTSSSILNELDDIADGLFQILKFQEVITQSLEQNHEVEDRTYRFVFPFRQIQIALFERGAIGMLPSLKVFSRRSGKLCSTFNLPMWDGMEEPVLVQEGLLYIARWLLQLEERVDRWET